jgi:group II intron reverse transcriptase/maturase
MTRQNNDNCAVPQGRRKAVVIPASASKRGGGKAIADDEQAYQLNLFDGAAAIGAQALTKGKGRSNRSVRTLPQVRKPSHKSRKDMPATMEEIIERLDQAQRNVVANHGSPGPNRQTVEMVREHWNDIEPKLTQSLLNGTYQPGEIRRVWIPKSGGGERGLGIPDVIDRIVQEATRMSVEPLYEPTFHQNSHGFRPKRSCHTAIEQARGYLLQGYHIVVDIDLKDFFNRVNHQRLLAKLAQRISDKRVLVLIGRMLKARVVMPTGVVIDTEQGVPQGGPLSPLLSNVYLDELDRELQCRGLRFVRYADDCNIYVRSERAGHRVMESIKSFLQVRMRLEVNEQKSAVARPEERHFVGFRLRYDSQKEDVEVLLSQRSHQRLRDKVVELTPRNFGNSIDKCIKNINVYLKGWIGFFGICTDGVERNLRTTDAHIRRRLRAIQLKQWKRKRTIARNLVARGKNRRKVMGAVYGKRSRIWALSHSSVVDSALNNSYWLQRGLRPLYEMWSKLKQADVAPVQMELDLV